MQRKVCVISPFINLCIQRLYSTVDLSHKVIGEDLENTEAAPIILLHDLLCSKKSWQGLGKVLFKVTKRSVVTVDLRNHGWSPHVSTHNYELLAADVTKLYKKLSIAKSCLIGHSMGGRTAMFIALKEPAKVKNLVVIDISPISNPLQMGAEYATYLGRMKEIDFKGIKSVHRAKETAREKLLPFIKDDVILDAILMNISRNRYDKIDWLCNLDVLIKEYKNIMSFPTNIKGKVYDGPTLFIGGQRSDFLPPDDLTGIRSYFPRAVVQYIPKSGHNLHIEKTDTFLLLVINFLRKNENI